MKKVLLLSLFVAPMAFAYRVVSHRGVGSSSNNVHQSHCTQFKKDISAVKSKMQYAGKNEHDKELMERDLKKLYNRAANNGCTNIKYPRTHGYPCTQKKLAIHQPMNGEPVYKTCRGVWWKSSRGLVCGGCE